MVDVSKSEVDRIVVPDDEKKRILPLYGTRLPVPTVGIYEGAVRYYKANLEWAKIIEGHVDWLAEIAAWMDAEDENYFAIQQILIFLQGIDIAGEFPPEGDCPNFAPSAAFLDYEPQNPYNEPDFVPPDYLVPPFLVNTALEYPEIMGYQATDVFVNFAAINIDPIDLSTFNLPRMIISVRGSGQIELDLLATAFGGIVVIKVGEMPNIADIILDNIIDTGIIILDLESAPSSVIHAGNIGRIAEINITAEPDEITEVFVVFAPKLNDSIIPVAFGGGIRAIQLCGFEGGTEGTGVEDVRFNSETCTLEKRVSGEWIPVEGWEYWLMCIPEGGDMATKQDIKEALIEWTQDTALKIALGEIIPFSVDDEGVVTVGGTAGEAVELPEDDPATEFDESLAANYGGTISVCRALELFLDKVDSYYGTVNGTPVMTLADTQTYIKSYFPCDDTIMDTSIATYYTYRGTNPRILFDVNSAFQLYMYCHGSNERGWSQWLVDSSAYPAAKLNVVLALTVGLAAEFWTSYYAAGIDKPSTAYVDASCVKMKTQTYTGLQYGVTRSLVPSPAKGGHRIRNKVSGYYVDPDGDLQDAFWYRTAAGVLSRSNFTFTHGSGANNTPSDSMVPYNTAHEYDYTIDLETGNNVWSVQFNRNANMNVASTSPTGGFNIEIEDLGQYTL